MASSSSMRRQITDLSEPLQIRELNRQLEWIWQHLLGGLTMKNMSDSGVEEVTELIVDTTSEIYDSQIEDIENDIDDIENDIDDIEEILADRITGVKGNAESTYRTGNVNLTPANIGAVSTGDIANNVTTTTSGKVLDARKGKALNDDISSVSGRVTTLENALVYPKSVPT